VAGGNKQRDYISKEDASSPTVCTESVLLSCIIDAVEYRDVDVIDIPNAFVQTCIEDEKDMAIIRIRGVLVDLLVEIAPDAYKPYVYKDRKGGNQLLVKCKNALYASLLYYRKFTKSLTDIGFKINPYDPCVANKMIDGEQMTICFHVDDSKLSHRKRKTMDKMIKWLRKNYELIFEDGSGKMTVSRGKVHKYLGMTLDYTKPGQVKVTMIEFVDEILTAGAFLTPRIATVNPARATKATREKQDSQLMTVMGTYDTTVSVFASIAPHFPREPFSASTSSGSAVTRLYTERLLPSDFSKKDGPWKK
jgi:hypothetical protein